MTVGGCTLAGSEAERTGAPARERLEAVQQVESLDQALADRTHVVGLTARIGFHRRPRLLAELPELWRGFGPEARPALLFGREDRGLEEEECARCTHLITIPTAELSSLNLSHAVAVTVYTLAAEGLLGAMELQARPQDEGREHDPWSSDEERQRFAEDILGLVASGGPPVTAEELAPALRRILAQPIESRDLRLLWRLLRHLRWLQEGQ